MALYDREYARQGAFGYESAQRDEAQIVSFVKDTYKLFAASMLAGGVGAYVGIPFAPVVAANYWWIAIPWMLFGMFGLQMIKNKPGVNMIGLFVFTFASGVIITPLLSHILGMAGGATIVGNAFFMTAALFGGLSFFAIKSSKDFTSWSKPIMIAFFIILAVSLINVFFSEKPAPLCGDSGDFSPRNQRDGSHRYPKRDPRGIRNADGRCRCALPRFLQPLRHAAPALRNLRWQ